MLAAREERSFPAAVISSSDPRAAEAARVVPKSAKIIRLGGCVIGYRHQPERFKRFRLNDMRFAELDRLACFLFQTAPPDEDKALLFARVIANHAPRDKAVRWCEKWCGFADWDDVEAVIDEAISNPETWRADSLARLLGVTKAMRDALGLRTIGAIDFTKRDRTIARKVAAKERMRALRQRRAADAALIANDKEGVRINTIRRLRTTSLSNIVAALEGGPLSVSQIVEKTGINHRLVRSHLSLAMKAGKIARVRRGVYRLTAAKPAPVLASLKKSKSVSGSGSLHRLSRTIFDMARPIQLAVRGRGQWLLAAAPPPTLATIH